MFFPSFSKLARSSAASNWLKKKTAHKHRPSEGRAPTTLNALFRTAKMMPGSNRDVILDREG